MTASLTIVALGIAWVLLGMVTDRSHDKPRRRLP